MLILGTVAYKRDWFNKISDSHVKLWLTVALLSIVYLITLGYAAGAFEGETDKLLGGLYWESFAYANWESIYCSRQMFVFPTRNPYKKSAIKQMDYRKKI